MKHTITKLDDNGDAFELSISDGWIDKQTYVSISIHSYPHDELKDNLGILISKDELHSLIGILLHLQSKLK